MVVENQNLVKYLNFNKNCFIVLEAQQRLIELETEKQRLDDELTRAQKKISFSEKAVATLTVVEPVIYDILKKKIYII